MLNTSKTLHCLHLSWCKKITYNRQPALLLPLWILQHYLPCRCTLLHHSTPHSLYAVCGQTVPLPCNENIMLNTIYGKIYVLEVQYEKNILQFSNQNGSNFLFFKWAQNSWQVITVGRKKENQLNMLPKHSTCKIQRWDLLPMFIC